MKLCLQLPGLKALSDIISWQPALSKPFPTADKQCSEQSCAGRQGCSTPLGVYRLGEIGPDPKAQQKQGCHSSMPLGPTGSKAECVFPVGTHTQNAHTYAYKKIHKWLAIQIPRPHGVSGSGWDSPCPSESQLLPRAHPYTLTHTLGSKATSPPRQPDLHCRSLARSRSLRLLAPQTRGPRDPWSHWCSRPLPLFSPVPANMDTQGLRPVLTGHRARPDQRRARPAFRRENDLDGTSLFYPIIPLFSHTGSSQK